MNLELSCKTEVQLYHSLKNSLDGLDDPTTILSHFHTFFIQKEQDPDCGFYPFVKKKCDQY